MKTILMCHACSSKQVHHASVATSTTPGLILPLLGQGMPVVASKFITLASLLAQPQDSFCHYQARSCLQQQVSSSRQRRYQHNPRTNSAITRLGHACSSKQVHHASVATSTTPGLILPLLGQVSDRRLVISQSRLYLIQTMFAQNKSPMEENKFSASFRTPPTSRILSRQCTKSTFPNPDL